MIKFKRTIIHCSWGYENCLEVKLPGTPEQLRQLWEKLPQGSSLNFYPESGDVTFYEERFTEWSPVVRSYLLENELEAE